MLTQVKSEERSDMRKPRMYGLFEKRGKRWVRLYPALYARKSEAVRLFQSALLEGSFGNLHRELRPLKLGSL